MILDATQLPPEGSALDGAAVCVIGSGPAGLTLASALARVGKDVVILEAGDIELTAESQDFYDGVNAGDPYWDLDTCRLRYFGGTSNHWAGWSRPMDDHDFEARPYVPLSGWPIGKRDIAPYLDAAAEILAIEPFPPDQPLAGAEGDFERVTMRYAGNKRLGESYLQEMKTSPRLRVVMNANVVDLEADPSSGAIRHAVFRHYGADSPMFRISAPIFVLACGGIENAWIMLNANQQFSDGIGNQHDLVGRNFLEHPHFDIGHFIDLSGGFGDRRNFVVTTRRFIERMEMLNCGVILHNDPGERTPIDFREKTILELCDIAPDLASRIMGGFVFECTISRIRVMSEQAPNLDSRVMLSKELNAFGQRRVRLEWLKTKIDRDTVVKTTRRLGEVFAATDMARLKIADWILDPDLPWPEDDRLGGPHHMGTTRMAMTPRTGVVDANCRVFGHSNLYIAGSSVFPTVGYANPTLTIMQLALRLGDHLATKV